MKHLWQAILDFFRQDFGPFYYGGTFLLLSIAVFINYSPIIDIQWATGRDSEWTWLSNYALLYGGLYFATAVLGAKGASHNYLGNPWFWVLSTAFIVIAILPKINFLQVVDAKAYPGWSGAERLFIYKTQFFLHQFVLTASFLVLMTWALSKRMSLDLGLRFNFQNVKPYFIILLMVSPLVVAASFLPGFQQAYPQYKPWFRDELAFGLSNEVRTAIFTSSYATGFLAVELLFRGALVLGMFRIMGSRAVLPMAAFYCAFHFGKPMGEAIASIFGGYVLGILALHGRSIAGGIIVHLGVAMLMELMGHLQHGLR
jgi:hypothetical protein